ncbi:M23 family peptidase [Kutzneria buriramensis]|uniref:PLL-like beta propeller domain-containing protein n=1 Tax=Kutzneria buriramensis TaxID=1045776 RepID=A0A3E0HQ06_9PSEU|nr:M23 family peptidase [Kutzneria buriramensis]REH48504.1 hypothetical protein BCF44_105363 [Kutzneria buriramensis]
MKLRNLLATLPVLELLLAGASVVAPTAAHAASTLGGPITRSEVISRAQYWVDNQPGPYDPNVTSAGPGGDGTYRHDCSGYVSMALHLAADPNTEGLPGYAVQIDRADLKPGDFLDRSAGIYPGDGHTFLFDHWDDGNGNFSYYSFGSTPVRHLHTNINNGSLDGHPNNSYIAYRYKNIRDDGPAPTIAGHRMVTAASADGRLEAFASGGDQIYHTYQTSVNGPWAPWAAIGGPGGAHLAIAPAGDGRLELFAINNDVAEHLYQVAVNGGWSNWETSFGGGGYDIAVGRNKSGRLEVVASNGGGVWHKYQSPETPGYWSGWSPMTDPTGNSGPGNSRLVATTSGDGRIEVFAINDGVFEHVYQTATDGGWSNWEANFGGGGYDIAVGRNKSGRLEVVASNGGGIWHKYNSDDPSHWSGWSEMTDAGGHSGPGNARLAAANAPDGRIEVFAINGSVAQHVYQTASDGGWSNWETDFGGGGTDVAVGADQNGTLVVLGSNPGGVYQKSQTPGGSAPWSGWSLVGPNGPGI